MPEMKVPLSWLEEFVDITLPIEELAERMTLAGLEVNSIDRFGEQWDPEHVVVGKVVEVRPHPNADSLTVPVIDYGADEPLAVVTGAPNIKVGSAGQKVAFAKAGARLIDGYADERKYMTLTSAEIRGIRSEGMVCSEKELDISDDHTGILILDDDAPVGTPLQDYLGETVLNIEIIPNIARCLAIIGVAREVAALTEQPLDIETPDWLAEGEPIEKKVEVEIKDPALCSRYSAGLIRDVEIGDSPLWMKIRLRAAGMRPINNIVDITNYIMLEWGQPLHAFDYADLHGREDKTPPEGTPVIIVRRAHQDETLTTLDKVERELDENMLLITDGSGPIALAGVMGGLESEVSDETSDVLLESANFDAINNRRTAQLLNLPSEASVRFGRGVDPESTVPALKRAGELMRCFAGGTIAQGVVDNYPNVPETKVIEFPPQEVERLAGVAPSAAEIVDILERLGFECKLDNPQGSIAVTVPSHRLDVTLKADLVEEVARIYGSENIPLTLLDEPLPPQRNAPLRHNRENARDILVGCGLDEIVTYPWVGAEDPGKLLATQDEPKPFDQLQEPGESYDIPCVLPAEACVEVANPLTPSSRFMRSTLLPRMLMTVAENSRYQSRVALFEIASVYLPRVGQALPDEPEHLAIAMTGPRHIQWWGENQGEAEIDFYDLKGVIETLFDRLNIEGFTFAPSSSPIFQPGRAAEIHMGETTIGVMGEIHPLVREAFELPDQRIAALELGLPELFAHVQGITYYEAISRFPLVTQDLALIVDEEVPAAQVRSLILQAGQEAIANVRLFDVYRGEAITEGKKSLAYAISYQNMERTLTDEDVNQIRDRIVDHVQQEVNAQVRR